MGNTYDEDVRIPDPVVEEEPEPEKAAPKAAAKKTQ